MIVRVSLPSWELVRELKTWKHVIRRVRWEWRWWHERICKVGGPSRFGERNYLQSASTCKTSRGLRRRHRSCRNLCLIWKNKAPLSWFEYSKLCKKSDGSLKKNFLFENIQTEAIEKGSFSGGGQMTTQRRVRQRSLETGIVDTFVKKSLEGGSRGSFWASEVQKLLEDWLSSSSSWVSLGQVTRGIRQRPARSSCASWVLRLKKN